MSENKDVHAFKHAPKSRTYQQIITDLHRPIPEPLLDSKKKQGRPIPIISWQNTVRLLETYAPGFETEVLDIDNFAEFIVLTVRLTIHASDGSWSRQATGSYNLAGSPREGTANYGDPFSNAEAMAFKRAAAKFGVGIGLADDIYPSIFREDEDAEPDHRPRNTRPAAENQNASRQSQAPNRPASQSGEPATEKQVAAMYAIAKKKGFNILEMVAFGNPDAEKFEDLTKAEAGKVLDEMQKG